MAEALGHPILNLTPEEKRVFGQLFARADTEKIGVVTGEVAVKFFEPTKLPAPVLGETGNAAGPLPKFEGLNVPPSTPVPSLPGPIQPQLSGGGPIRVPPLTPDKVAEYSALFGRLGAQNGVLSGETAKNIFEKAGLSNDTLGRIWNLADTQSRGALDMTEFIIAMHLIASYKSGVLKALPSNLPPGLYEAASRRGPGPALRLSGGSRPGEPVAIQRQFTGQGPQRAASPLSRPPYPNAPQSPHSVVGDWAITPQEKASYDELFNKVDTANRGYITGEQAVLFFSNSGLPEDILATIWDLADINSEGRLSRDEFAVAMYLIKQQKPRPGQPRLNLPASLPPNLVPPSMRNQVRPAQQPTAPAFDNAAFATPKLASEDLFGLDVFSSPIPAQSTGGSVPYSKPVDTDPFGNKSASPTSPQATISPAPRNPASMFKPFQPSSTFGQGLTTQSTGASVASSQPQMRGPQTSAMDDLLGDNDPEVSNKLTQETTELANMSNQIGTLRNQMQDVQQKKSATESDLSSAGKQKRELEQRLAQFRSQYEQEVKQVKALEEQLAASRNDTRKLHQELAMVEGTHQDLQTQHRQVLGALEADQHENASLKERIRNINMEISQLRPQLDKMRSDARQQKGMVAINKKQLATNESERDRMRYGGVAAGVETPTNVEAASPAATPVQEREVSRGSDRPEASRSDTGSLTNPASDRNQTSSPAASANSDAARAGSKSEEPKDSYQPFGPPSTLKDLPGAFPTEPADSIQPTPTGESAVSEQSKGSTRPSEGFSSTRTEPFSSMNGSQNRGPSTAKHDFDAAFAEFGGSRTTQERQNTGSSVNGSADNASASKFSREFPPIENLDHDEDSDSTSEPGFDDDFTAASPKPRPESVNAQGQSQLSRPPTSTTNVDEQLDYAFRPRPPVSQIDSSASLPPASAQKSPPAYEQAISPPGGGPVREELQFTSADARPGFVWRFQF
ncbi:hypothetical protein H2199_005157 [Coniosporium tulheliwenetii]|uniref:Uncharacterized protein n=1 Tax=Coniosporium tulheliwenetii TaxID=3383036 RepID=A0ACC2Z3M3_9PEZI|nr:hypothetical protein H2199_005157 [Cladosporium sp. JES 115]